jgi:hypothetical protein
MTQLTLRGFDRELERRIRSLARRERVSLNQAALRLMRKGAGLSSGSKEAIGDALDPFVGSLAADDAEAADDAIRRADLVDLQLQRKESAKHR